MANGVHDKIAEALAAKKGVEYRSDKGIDVKTATQAIEVEVDPSKFKEGIRQLQGTDKNRYLAVPTRYKKEALEATEGLKTGVMTQSGKIVKRARTHV